MDKNTLMDLSMTTDEKVFHNWNKVSNYNF